MIRTPALPATADAGLIEEREGDGFCGGVVPPFDPPQPELTRLETETRQKKSTNTSRFKFPPDAFSIAQDQQDAIGRHLLNMEVTELAYISALLDGDATFEC